MLSALKKIHFENTFKLQIEMKKNENQSTFAGQTNRYFK